FPNRRRRPCPHPTLTASPRRAPRRPGCCSRPSAGHCLPSPAAATRAPCTCPPRRRPGAASTPNPLPGAIRPPAPRNPGDAPMSYATLREGQLRGENVALADVAAHYGTPCYVYRRAAISANFLAYRNAGIPQPLLVCYAVKANSNLAVLNVLARLGAGFDIVSGGELERVLRAGGDPARVVFSGVGKQADEMRRALQVGIRCFNVESEPELHALNAVAGALGVVAPVSLRVNPDVDAQTHPYISTGLEDNKFGIDIREAPAVYRIARDLPHIAIRGVDCHIGSQLTETAPFLDALDRVLALLDELAA